MQFTVRRLQDELTVTIPGSVPAVLPGTAGVDEIAAVVAKLVRARSKRHAAAKLLRDALGECSEVVDLPDGSATFMHMDGSVKFALKFMGTRCNVVVALARDVATGVEPYASAAASAFAAFDVDFAAIPCNKWFQSIYVQMLTFRRIVGVQIIGGTRFVEVHLDTTGTLMTRVADSSAFVERRPTIVYSRRPDGDALCTEYTMFASPDCTIYEVLKNKTSFLRGRIHSDYAEFVMSGIADISTMVLGGPLYVPGLLK
jgi:hypothetical protein